VSCTNCQQLKNVNKALKKDIGELRKSKERDIKYNEEFLAKMKSYHSEKE
jgi:hypothetical protein